MKEKSTLKSLLGIEQEEIAIILGISRSQFSMYASGKRKLPLQAKEELTRILLYLKENDLKNRETRHFIKREEDKIQKQLEKQIQLNQYKALVLDKKIKIIEKLHNESLVALRLAEYLETREPDEMVGGMSTHIRFKAMEMLSKTNEQLRKHILSKETLEQQNKILEKDIMNERHFFSIDFESE
jgi:transcriptional regulator with XRE-family HTH domain